MVVMTLCDHLWYIGCCICISWINDALQASKFVDYGCLFCGCVGLLSWNEPGINLVWRDGESNMLMAPYQFLVLFETQKHLLILFCFSPFQIHFSKMPHKKSRVSLTRRLRCEFMKQPVRLYFQRHSPGHTSQQYCSNIGNSGLNPLWGPGAYLCCK